MNTRTPFFDPRVTPVREDIAAACLRGKVASGTFVEPTRFQVQASSVPMRRARDASLGYETELVHGERIDVYELKDGWAWGQAVRDGYVGYVESAALLPESLLPESLAPESLAPTHRVLALRSFLYPGPGIKTAPLGFLPYGAEIRVEAFDERFARTAAGHVFAAHLAPLDDYAADPVQEAERFLGTPYLWGGKTSLGIDCSGLVQSACHACGIAASRDSDMQEKALGAPLAIPNDPRHFARGDLLFWRGHVALCQGEGRMIHATAFSMSVISEEMAPALERIAGQGHPLRTARRLPKA